MRFIIYKKISLWYKNDFYYFTTLLWIIKNPILMTTDNLPKAKEMYIATLHLTVVYIVVYIYEHQNIIIFK